MLTLALSVLAPCLWAVPAFSMVTAQAESVPAVAATSTVTKTERPAPASKKKKRKRNGKHKSQRDVESWSLSLPGAASMSSGYLHGLTYRAVSTPVVVSDVKLRPGYGNKIWEFTLPVNLTQRSTFAESLDQTEGGVALKVESKQVPRLTLGAAAEVLGAFRPSWPDPYQPQTDGSLTKTDRHSYYERSLRVEAVARPARRNWLAAGYQYSLVAYEQDPAFDAFDAPSHLVPGDHERHQLELYWRFLKKPFKLEVGAQGFLRQSFFFFARDAHTGATHAGRGGAPPNPLQETRGIEPEISVRWRSWAERWTLSGTYGYAVVEDTFQGYYSSASHHVELVSAHRLGRTLRLEVAGEGWLLKYGPRSYREGPGHPPLTSGDRRFDRRLQLRTEASAPLGHNLVAELQAKWVVRETNFPAYRPGIFPASRSYDIEWNYENVLVLLGLKYTW